MRKENKMKWIAPIALYFAILVGLYGATEVQSVRHANTSVEEYKRVAKSAN